MKRALAEVPQHVAVFLTDNEIWLNIITFSDCEPVTIGAFETELFWVPRRHILRNIGFVKSESIMKRQNCLGKIVWSTHVSDIPVSVISTLWLHRINVGNRKLLMGIATFRSKSQLSPQQSVLETSLPAASKPLRVAIAPANLCIVIHF